MAVGARQTRRGPVVAALMLAMFMAAIEATIVATAMPTIVGSLSGFHLYSWVFSIYLLTQAAAIPIYGKLADIYGRKPIFHAGTMLFLIASLLCGLATTMSALILFRALQGLGAAAVMPIATTIVGDLFPLQERAKVQGWLSSVWGVSSVVGPTLGGFIVVHLSWPWVFFINIPVGLLAMLGLTLFLHENVERRPHRIDVLGSLLLVVGVSSSLVFLLQGGAAWAWLSSQSLFLVALTVLALVLFLWQENRAPEPLLPLDLFRNRMISVVNVATLFAGALTLGVTAYVPTFVQGVGGSSAFVAGLTLGAMSLGWPLASVLSGRMIIRYGFYRTVFLGATLGIIGSIMLALLPAQVAPTVVAAATFVIGLGLGFTSTSYIVMIQGAVDWSRRGVATGANMFLRQMGGAIGIAVLGATVNSSLQGSEVTQAQTEALLDAVKRSLLPPAELNALVTALSQALHWAFWGIVVITAMSLLTLLLLPKQTLEPLPSDSAQPGPKNKSESNA